MRILYLGDIYGEKTLDVLEAYLPEIKKEENINIVLANAENTTDGKGLSQKHYKRLMSLGIQGLSMGNHTFSKSEIKEYIDDANIVIPANLNAPCGTKILYLRYNDKKIALISMLGRVFNSMPLDCPFKTMDELLEHIDADYTIMDFHADATSEKKAFFYEFHDKLAAQVGTHTHVQTADEEVYDGSLYISDIGMCGPKRSIIGMDPSMAIERFRTGLYNRMTVADSKEYMINAVVLDINDKNPSIKRINKTYRV